METVRVVAPAKVNLFLGIGERRPDGYHSATTVMHALAMHDTIEMTLVGPGEEVLIFEPGDAAQPMRQLELAPSAGSGLAVGANMQWAAGLEPAVVADEDNLACKAVHALAEALSRQQDECIRLVINKRIPHQSGLGGGSADAAAALVGAASLWGLVPGDERVEQVARTLGADVAFFLHGGCALLDGVGERFVRALEPSKDNVVIIKPDGGVSTSAAYAAFDEEAPCVPPELLGQLDEAQAAAGVPLFNNLAGAAERLHDQLAQVREFAAGQPGVGGVLLTGSGAGTFCVCDSYAHAQELSAAAQRAGWWARSTSFSSLRAAVLP